MTRVLVVHHDLDLGGQEADLLRRFGYDVIECGGPTRNRCPVLAGHPCDLAERADVLVYDVGRAETRRVRGRLIRTPRHPSGYSRRPTSPGLKFELEVSSGADAVTMLTGQPTGARLHEAIQAALASAPGASR